MSKSKIIIVLLIGIIIGVAGTYWVTKQSSANSNPSTFKFAQPTKHKGGDKRVFINASMNTNGKTSAMARKFFGSKKYTQINLADYNIPQIGQGNGDFNKVYNQLKGADVILIGTPVYWSNMSGYLKTFIDHMQINNDLQGADLYTIVQGADSNQSAAEQSVYGTLNRISIRFKMHFVGIATNDSQVKQLKNKMNSK